MAEVLGVREALYWVKRMGIYNVMLKTDALEVVRAFHSSVLDNSSYCLVVGDCLALSSELVRVKFRFCRRFVNQVAHSLARAVGSMSASHEWFQYPPSIISDVLTIDSYV